MQRKPRHPAAPLFSMQLLRRSIGLGAMVLGAVVLVYALALPMLSEEQARALSFAALIAASLALILVSRTPEGELGKTIRRPNPSYWWIAGASLSLLFTGLYWPPAAAALHFAAPPPHLLIAALLAVVAAILMLGHRLRMRRQRADPCREP